VDVLRRSPLGQTVLEDYKLPPWKTGNVTDVDELVVIYHNWDEIRRLMWDLVGIVRSDERLALAAARLDALKREIGDYYARHRIDNDLLELRNVAEVASLIVRSAQLRNESRGLHFNRDHPELADRAADTVISPPTARSG
jgi:L-aspartate oxidase